MQRPFAIPVRRAAAVVAAIVLMLAACSSPFQSRSEEASVRLYNDSPFHLDHARFSSGTDPVLVGRVNSGMYSTYRVVPVVYSVGYVEALIDGRLFSSRAEDFSAHARLPGGSYTYRVRVDSTRRLLHVIVIQD